MKCGVLITSTDHDLDRPSHREAGAEQGRRAPRGIVRLPHFRVSSVAALAHGRHHSGQPHRRRPFWDGRTRSLPLFQTLTNELPNQLNQR